MDARFHGAQKDHSKEVAALVKSLSPERARDLAKSMPRSVLLKRVDGESVLLPLMRGTRLRGGMAEAEKAIDEYPHLALALLSKHLPAAAQEAEDEQRGITEVRTVIDEILGGSQEHGN